MILKLWHLQNTVCPFVDYFLLLTINSIAPPTGNLVCCDDYILNIDFSLAELLNSVFGTMCNKSPDSGNLPAELFLWISRQNYLRSNSTGSLETYIPSI